MAGSSCFSILVASAIFVCSATKSSASSLQLACDKGASLPLVYWEQHPYIYRDQRDSRVTGVLLEILHESFKACCKSRAIVSAKRLEYPASLKDTIQNHPQEVIIPVGRRTSYRESIFLRPFLGLIDSPGIAVVAQKSIPGEELVAAIYDSWPILIFIGMSVSLSAIVMWALDCHSNPDEFPEYFLKGVFESFWWSAVTMTTVGYGDKVPRSVAGRIFGVVWVNVGLVILAIFMGMITASLSSNSLEQINNLYGITVAVMNGTAEEQLAILQNAEVHVRRSYDDLYRSVTREETRIALVDLYSTTKHSEYYNKYQLYVAKVLSEPIVYGAVLPTGSETVRNCFLSYQAEHQLEMHEILEKFIKAEKYHSHDSNLGVEYFQGSTFGYTIYFMFGLFTIALVVGLLWQYYPREKKEEKLQTGSVSSAEQQITKTGPAISPKETVDIRSLNHEGLLPSNESQHIERLMAAQSAEVLAMEDELKAFRKNWENSFRSLQERHKKEQERLLGLDNFGYEM